MRKALWAAGLRYRLHLRTPYGRPDIVFPYKKVAVFIDGCFWHGCPLHYVRPRSQEEFWATKLRQNIQRDRRQTGDLESAGWRVVRIWEHELADDIGAAVLVVRSALCEAPWSPGPSPRVHEVNEAQGGERWNFVDLRDNVPLASQWRPRKPL
jgi:DNA mismatch endonuclease, patch repair protein